MDELFRDFVAWLTQFAVVSTVLLLGAHLVGRAMRNARPSESPTGPVRQAEHGPSETTFETPGRETDLV